ncbi:hypothetical protein CAPTEDRAFT_220011 [Capitella teleta]|uniref:SOCS box domain-containing protein n=1 Tax=Capitella teleta TaxID=283909 RepID=R7V9I9_CAPTE|nr:hypothetical protein CAPTEDRAFT_220011 [Capitella teleta]|eukprot:ELU15518.1 hypothetical protein CAPTEDRAFT_220011 [Capitella teleta]
MASWPLAPFSPRKSCFLAKPSFADSAVGARWQRIHRSDSHRSSPDADAIVTTPSVVDLTPDAMGAGLSVEGRQHKAGQEDDVTGDKRSLGATHDWCVMQTLDAGRWVAPQAQRSGFDFPVHWSQRQLSVKKWPWSDFLVKSNAGDLCSFSCVVKDSGRQEKLPLSLRDARVVGFHPRVLVVQVVLSRSVKLLVVDWKEGDLLATYSFQYTGGEPCYQECFLSPDASIMVSRQDSYLRRRRHHVMTPDPNIRVFRIKDGLCQRLFVIEDRLALSLSGSALSFDPRFPEGRLTVLSSTQQAAVDDSRLRPNRLRVYDLPTNRVINAAPSATDKLAHHAVHSPDGRLVAVLGINASIHIDCRTFVSCVDVYCADSLQRLWHCALQDGPCSMKSLHAFPAFSRNGSLLAIFSGESTRKVHLHRMPHHDRSLRDACRTCILHHTPRECVHQLPLPNAMLDFLLFKN